MTTPETPRTAAGRAHLDRIAPAPAPDAQELHRRSAAARREATAKAILAIEAEAAAPQPGDPSWRPCVVCGKCHNCGARYAPIEAAAPQPGEHHVHTFPNGEDCECGKTWADARFAPQPFPASQDLDRWASAGGQE